MKYIDSLYKFYPSFILKIICLMGITLLHFNLIAQQNTVIVKGRIIDKSGAPISYAIIGVFKNTARIKGIICDSLGKFNTSLQVGDYGINVTALGFLEYKNTITITKSDSLNIVLQSQINQLEEVAISVQKPLFEHKIDRLIFNVENSIIGQGVDALEVLRQTPMIDLSQEQIKLIGRDNVGIMIDGKLLQLPPEDLNNRLKEIRSDNISKIEVITSPPAKYSAQGNSGLINIILKKNPLFGWQFFVGSAYTQRTYSGISEYGYLKYKTTKLDFSIGASGFVESKKYTSEYSYNFFNYSRGDTSYRKTTTKNTAFNTLLNYDIKKNMQIGFMGDLTFEHNSQFSQVNSVFAHQNNGIIDSIMTASTMSPLKYTFADFSTYYDCHLDTSGKKLSIAYSFFSKNASNISTVNLNTIILDQQYSNLLIGNSNTFYKGNSINLELELPYKFIQIEGGGAISVINNTINMAPYITLGKNNLTNPNITNDFDYKERTNALYISGSKKINGKLTAKLGFRYESTCLESNSLATNQKHIINYRNLFPTFYLSYNLDKSNSFSLNYSKRIEKPDFYALNPYKVYSTINSYTSGNPYLLPSFSNNFELSYRFENNLNVTVYSSLLTNGYDYVTRTTNNNSILITSPSNFFNKNTFGANISYNYVPSKWLNSYNGFNFSNNEAKSHVPSIMLPNVIGNNIFFSSRNTLTINKKNATYLEINYMQSLANTYDFSVLKDWSSLDVGVRSKALNNNLEVRLLVRDILRKNMSIGKTTYTNFLESYRNYSDMRNFNISIAYNFGNSKVKGISRDSKDLNKDRAVQ